MKVLLVEGDNTVSALIQQGFSKENHECVVAQDGEAGLENALGRSFDVIISDVILPKLDGISLLQSVRQHNIHTPFVFLSAKANVEDKVRGLRQGACDYIAKPFVFEELLVRTEVASGAHLSPEQRASLSVGELTLDLVNRKVLKGETEIELQSKEFQLLECLLRHKGQVVARSTLLEQVWNYHFDPQTNVIDVHISRLRQKVDKVLNTSLIETVRGTGYRIVDKVAC